HALAKRLAAVPGCAIANDGPFFDRFTLRTDMGGWDLRLALLDRGIQVEATASHYVGGKRAGLDVAIVQCTEMTNDTDADALVDAVTEITASRKPVAAR
ncbi:MAG: hypothetical protein M3R54_00020, partial [Chloroflexota bacterium]|nr:hypothetical protein [Chloroflexota bacterium]